MAVEFKGKSCTSKDLKDQNLMNQIIVVTRRTGEESAVRIRQPSAWKIRRRIVVEIGAEPKWRWNWYRQGEQRWHHNGYVHLSKNRDSSHQRAVSGTDSAFVSFLLQLQEECLEAIFHR